MTVEKMLYTATVQTPVAWNYVSIKRRLCISYSSLCWPDTATPSTVWAQAPAPSQSSQTTAYHYTVPSLWRLRRRLRLSVCVPTRISSYRNSCGHGSNAAGSASRRRSHHPYKGIEFR